MRDSWGRLRLSLMIQGPKIIILSVLNFTIIDIETHYGWSGGQRIFDTENYGFTSDLRYAVGEKGEIRSITAYMKNTFQDTPDSNSATSRVTFDSVNRDLLT